MTAPSVRILRAGAIVAPTGRLLGDPVEAWRERTRRELGLAPEGRGPVAAAGHQPGLWHPGILAKFIHARALAGRDGVVLHVVVDHDAVDPALVRVPVRRLGRLSSATHRFGAPSRGEAAMALAAFSPRRYEGPAALPSVVAGLARAAEALESARSAPNAALQTAEAASALMRPWVGDARVVAASGFLACSLGRALLDEMRRDPHRCARTFNEALRIDPRAATALRTGVDPELPLWTLGPDGRRRRVTHSQLRGGGETRFLPRAFLLGAFLRLGLCDRVVHGVGALRYERVTEAWFREWLGVELPPFDMATATILLPLGGEGATARPAEAGAIQERRRAWWDPESLDGTGSVPGPAKLALLAEISRLPRRSPQRREAHRRLVRLLESLRADRAEHLAALDERLQRGRVAAEEAAVASDRTWPFVYFEAPSLDELASLVRGAPSTGGSASGSGR